MAEEVINALTQLEGLHVVARTSAFSFKGRDIDIRARKSGDRILISRAKSLPGTPNEYPVTLFATPLGSGDRVKAAKRGAVAWP